jgi:tRNA(Leu) C34 or U34 (ribose-2'-O)-methylase TrmL
VWWTGRRVTLDIEKGERLPREERMKAYRDVQQIQFDRPFEQFPRGVVPVALDLFPNSEDLITFEHPENAIYVFGPEDGGVDKVARSFCHRFVSIPTKACLNLSAAVNVVLYDRVAKSRR